MTEQDKEKYMRRCFALAEKGSCNVAPNPMVGCVIVCDDRIIGEGYHRVFGGPHAEINALSSVRPEDLPLLRESTVFVSLEPCSHYGKTPPCALRLINEKVKRVIACNADPNPQVAGRGMRMLQEAGIETGLGLLEAEGRRLNRRFFTFHEKHRPYIILKWAQSSDGFIDGEDEKPIVISNGITKALVHKMRAENMAIMVGTRTALKDNPKLHTRRWYGKNPLRIAIDRNLRIPAHYHLYDGSAETIIYNGVKNDGICRKLDFDQDIIPQICDDLYKLGIQSLIVEGGKQTLDSFIEAGMYDEMHIEVSPLEIGKGTRAPEINFPPNAEMKKYGNNRIYVINA